MMAVARTLGLSLLLAASGGALSDTIFEFGGHTYKIVHTPASWNEASKNASEMKLGPNIGYLAVINTANENRAVLNAILKHASEEDLAKSIPDDGSDAPFVWLGGSDKSREGAWVWSDGVTQFWSGDFNGKAVGNAYTNWGVQPDSATGSEDALAMSIADWPAPFYDLGAAGQWNDLNEGNKLLYVIEFNGKTDLKMALEQPTAGAVHSGIGLIAGWAISSDDILSVELFIDGKYHSDIPHGGLREDVGNAFSKVPGSANAGFASATNFSALAPGIHTARIRVTDRFGSSMEKEASFETAAFHKNFVSSDDEVQLSGAFSSGIRDLLMIYGAEIDGKRYNIALQWTTATQGFEIVSIQPVF